MAPDRGNAHEAQDNSTLSSPGPADGLRIRHVPTKPASALEATHFSFRSIMVGLAIGIVICFSNMYFGLQTGWVSSMAMPSALLGFSYFKLVSRYISYPFTPVENVLIQSVAGAVGTMPLGCGFVGVVPALNYLLKPSENGPLRISLPRMIVWSLGIAFFGVVFAVPLRRQVIIREKLKFPSGTAAALMIGILHGEKPSGIVDRGSTEATAKDGFGSLARDSTDEEPGTPLRSITSEDPEDGKSEQEDWRARIRLLLYAFGFSSVYTLFSYFVPLNNVPLFGSYLADQWLFTMNFSPAYVGQGIIMGAPTSLSMLLGALVGYGILSPLARNKGWAPGPVDDWATGSKGWIVWISLAIMLIDSIVSLGWLVLRPIIHHGPSVASSILAATRTGDWNQVLQQLSSQQRGQYSAIQGEDMTPRIPQDDEDRDDAPPSHLISTRTTIIGLIISSIFCIVGVHVAFGSLIPVSLTILALLFAMVLSVMGVRALGETDLNPVSGISKLTQLLFAFFTPAGSKNAVIINLIAGALSESGALQAGDLLQDLKTGHLLGAAPSAQFYGQIIGSAVGAVVSAVVYELYTRVYTIPGELFEVPTSYVWIYTARLVTGSGLPPRVPEWAAGAAALFALSSMLRIWLAAGGQWRKNILPYIPGGIAVAVGMYNSPSFTFARAIGGVLIWWWKSYSKRPEVPIIVLASGLILGEGLFSIVNLVMASLGVPHL
ncbi:OPT superfamily oligopeptide transporter [Microthyrium microscopicum]|uniref:OPT superfamily oligopeptide transporter n=1 Tax=Microthyrium microscopicum TaxID=703497 RepID=A0A6A6UVP7_9PEZI|nr:OPT superfamily oligopeptide transporter [Microthyrium microscopicum]